MDNRHIPREGRFLAHGAAAEVWLVDVPGVHGSKYVLKVIRVSLETLQENHDPKGPRKASQLWEDFISNFKSKVNQWEPVTHVNVVRVLGISGGLDLCVEYLVGGSAPQYLAEHPTLQIPLRKRMVGDVLSGLDYLHSQNPPIVHGSVRMDKLFIDNQGTTKIGEFGLASLFEGFDLFVPSVSQVGRIRWISPELLEENAMGQRPAPTMESDIWALGCTLFEIISGRLPYFRYKHDLQVWRAVISKKPPGDPDELLTPEFTEFWRLLTPCWEWTSKQRPPIAKLVQSSRRVASRSGDNRLGSRDDPPQNLYGLIIGINTYPSLSYLNGAFQDARNMSEFLISNLGIPANNITNLYNEQATRKRIIEGFQALLKNPMIEYGDPILIYYAGHGGLARAGADWEDKDGTKHIQVIFPFDYKLEDPATTELVNCIPDKTIARLLKQLAVEKGDNITVIFDCGYSSSGTHTGVTEPLRETSELHKKYRNAQVALTIPHDIDDDIFVPYDAKTELGLYADQAFCVYLLACGIRQQAAEVNGQGVFTTALLKKIRESPVENVTYHNLMKSLEMLSEDQSPQCYGKHKNRKVFNSYISSRDLPFISVNFDEGKLVLAAGDASGVTVGSIWELYEAPTENSPSVAKLKVRVLYGSTAILESVEPHIELPESDRQWYARCIEIGPGNELKVWMSSNDRQLVFQDREHIGGVHETGTGYVMTSTRDAADFVLEVRYPDSSMKEAGTAEPEVVFHWCDELAVKYGVSELKHRKPVRRDAVEVVLFAAANWRWHLRRGNSRGRIVEDVVTMNMLKVGNRVGRRRTFLKHPEPIPINADGVVDFAVENLVLHGFKLSSDIGRELYVRMFYFDATDFSIGDMFGHNTVHGRATADIPARGQLLIGDGADGGTPVKFNLSPGNQIEMGYMKVFWSTEPLELDHIEQISAFKMKSGDRGAGVCTDDTDSEWGTVCLPLVLREHQ